LPLIAFSTSWGWRGSAQWQANCQSSHFLRKNDNRC